jgi:hypothetical protein
MNATRLVITLLAGFGLAACEGLTPTQQNVGIGALGGAAIGGVAGSFSGNAGLGALIGGGVGGVGGYLYDQSQQSRRSYR